MRRARRSVTAAPILFCSMAVRLHAKYRSAHLDNLDAVILCSEMQRGVVVDGLDLRVKKVSGQALVNSQSDGVSITCISALAAMRVRRTATCPPRAASWTGVQLSAVAKLTFASFSRRILTTSFCTESRQSFFANNTEMHKATVHGLLMLPSVVLPTQCCGTKNRNNAIFFG